MLYTDRMRTVYSIQPEADTFNTQQMGRSIEHALQGKESYCVANSTVHLSRMYLPIISNGSLRALSRKAHPFCGFRVRLFTRTCDVQIHKNDVYVYFAGRQVIFNGACSTELVQRSLFKGACTTEI